MSERRLQWFDHIPRMDTERTLKWIVFVIFQYNNRNMKGDTPIEVSIWMDDPNVSV